MPIYVYRCHTCGLLSQIFKRLSHLDREERCDVCFGLMSRQVTAPAVVSDYAGYSCPITGKWIEGRKAHHENLAKHGCRVYEPGETDAFKRRQAADEAALDERIGETAEALVHAMPTRKREQLIAEIQAGATAEVTRPSINPGVL